MWSQEITRAKLHNWLPDGVAAAKKNDYGTNILNVCIWVADDRAIDGLKPNN